jgi:choline-glycine betaine transporter
MRTTASCVVTENMHPDGGHRSEMIEFQMRTHTLIFVKFFVLHELNFMQNLSILTSICVAFIHHVAAIYFLFFGNFRMGFWFSRPASKFSPGRVQNDKKKPEANIRQVTARINQPYSCSDGL